VSLSKPPACLAALLILGGVTLAAGAAAIECDPTPSAPPASFADLIECLSSFQSHKSDALLALQESVADGDPGALEDELEALIAWKSSAVDIVEDAYGATLIRQGQRRALLACLTKAFAPLERQSALLSTHKDKGPQEALKRIKDVVSAHNKMDRRIQKLAADRALALGATISLKNTSSAGFTSPNKNVCFTVKGCTAFDASNVSIVNPAQALNITPILPGSVTVTDKSGSTKEVCVVTADSSGGGRISIAACGTTLRSPLLFNKGETILEGVGGGLVTPLDLFTGTCTGSYSGIVTWDDGTTTPVAPGAVSSTFTGDGLVQIHAPSQGTGKISRSGLNFATGAGSLGAAGYTVRWAGQMWIPRTGSVVNTATARGSWSLSTPVAKASGGWQVSCIIGG
jgi:hypothetical protein